MEGMPIRLVIVAIILVIIVGVSFWQMDYFLQFKAEKDFKENVVIFAQTVKTLKSTGDFGAFTTVQIRVPTGFSFTMDLDNDSVTGILPKEAYGVNMTDFLVNMTAVRLDGEPKRNETVSLEGGNTYNFMIYYGRLQDEEVKAYTLVFE